MKKLYILMALAMTCLLPKFALAKILSSSAQSVMPIPFLGNTNVLHVRGVYKMYFNVKPSGNTNEQDLKKCLTLTHVRASWEELQSGNTTAKDSDITSLTSHELLISGSSGIETTLQKGKITGNLANKCPRTVEFGMNISDILDDKGASIDSLWIATITVPAGKTCGVELKKNYINFGTIVPGEPIKHGYVEFNSFTGSNNTVEITSSDLSDYKLKLGSSDKFIITVPSQHRKNPHTWLVDKTHYSLELIPKADRSLQPGTYTSNLDVSLTCQ